MRDPRLDAARARFDAAEKHLDRMHQRLADTSQKLLKAGMDLAAIDRQIESFATSVDADPASAAHLVGERETARNVALLLEQAEAFLESEAAKAKGAVIDAENACRAAQLAAVQEQIDSAKRELVRANAKAVQRLLKLMNTAAALGTDDGLAGKLHPEHLFGHVLVDAVKELWPETDSSRAAFFPDQDELSELAVSSAKVSNDERSRYRSGGLNALMPDDIDPPTVEEFDVADAVRRAQHAEAAVRTNRDLLAEAEHSLRIHPGSPSAQKRIDELKAEIDRGEQVVATWNRRVSDYQANQEN